MKKVLAMIFIMSIFTVVFAQQVQSGDFIANKKAVSGFTLDANEGDRTVSLEVSFDKPFDIKPSIIVSVSILEATNSTPIRYNVSPTAISRDGFVIKIVTWGNTKIDRIGGSWIAVSGKE